MTECNFSTPPVYPDRYYACVPSSKVNSSTFYVVTGNPSNCASGITLLNRVDGNCSDIPGYPYGRWTDVTNGFQIRMDDACGNAVVRPAQERCYGYTCAYNNSEASCNAGYALTSGYVLPLTDPNNNDRNDFIFFWLTFIPVVLLLYVLFFYTPSNE